MQTDPLITPGSSLYYALLYTPKPEQEAIALLIEFFNEIKSIADNVSESEVAKAKLMWWSKEISQTYKHYPQHPLSKSLSNIIQRYSLEELEFLTYINAIHSSLDEPPSAIEDKFASHLDEYRSKLLLLSAITSHSIAPETFIFNLSIALQGINDIRTIGREIKRHPDFYPPESHVELQNDLRWLANEAKSYCESAIASLNASQRAKQLPWIIYANIQLSLLAEITKMDFNILDKKISLTPLRKLWIAWQTKRREKKTVKHLYKLESR